MNDKIDSEYLSNRNLLGYFELVDNRSNVEKLEDKTEDAEQEGVASGVYKIKSPNPATRRGSMSSLLGKYEADIAAGGVLNKVTSIASLLSGSHVNQNSHQAAGNAPPLGTKSTINVPSDAKMASKSANSSLRSNKNYVGSSEAKASTQLPFKSLNVDMFDEALLEKLREESLSKDREVQPSWRFKERMRTAGVGLILALNIGTDPPDVIKPNPCAKLQCWMDPSSTSRAKAREKIGELLENQYAKWQGQQKMKMKYRRALDPTPDEVRTLLRKMRSATKSNERILLHYNGCGVPRPTINGELWVFDRGHTQYIPLSVLELKSWMGKPSMVVLDCNAAGVLLPFFTKSESSTSLSSFGHFESSGNLDKLSSGESDIIVLCPTSESEILPMNPDLPADLFTSCLTTPIKMALHWFIRQNPLSCSKIDPESVDDIPGAANDRKTPLGELNWVFTAITDSIAWNVLPTPLFQSLFRQDLMVASMFRNFLLADRILRELKCTPQSVPSIPSTCNHPLWQAWDLAVETCLTQLIEEGFLSSKRQSRQQQVKKDDDEEEEEEDEHQKSKILVERAKTVPPIVQSSLPKKKSPNLKNVSSPFFSEQLTSFEIWLEYATNRVNSGGVVLEPPKKQYDSCHGIERMAYYIHPGLSQDVESPEQLPVVLQVLLSPTHRVRALILLRRFMYLGPSAVNLALSVGICPYVLKLLQSSIDEYKHMLIGIWSKILLFDRSCKEDLLKDQGIPQIIKHLHWGLNDLQEKMQLSDDDKSSCRRVTGFEREDEPSHQRTMSLVILSIICDNYSAGQMGCLKHNLIGQCLALLQAIEFDLNSEDTKGRPKFPSEFRVWICICLGVLCKDNIVVQAEACKADIHMRLAERITDECSDVRAAACFALGMLVYGKRSRPSTNTIDTSSAKSAPFMSPEHAGIPLLHSPTPAQANFSPYGPPLTPVMSSMPLNLQQQSSPLMPLQPQVFQPTLSQHQPDSPLKYLVPSTPISLSQSPGSPETKNKPDIDSVIFDSMLSALLDGSAIVRNEALVVLGTLVEKYLYEFVVVANRYKRNSGNIELQLPSEISQDMESVLQKVWKRIHHVHQSDPHPVVSNSASIILRYVNERLLMIQTGNSTSGNIDRITSQASHTNLSSNAEDGNIKIANLKQHHRTQSAINLNVDRGAPLATITERSRTPSPKNEFSRSASPEGGLAFSSPFIFDSLYEDDDTSNIILESKFYETKLKDFEKESRHSRIQPLDPLSSDGALKLHRLQRNKAIDTYSRTMSEKYAILTPRPQVRKGMIGDFSTYDSRASLLGDIDDRKDSEEAIARETEIAAKKASLHMYEENVLRHEGAQITNQLCFHSYAPFIAASDGVNRVGIWNTDTATKVQSVKNGNVLGTRITSMSWINERNHSLLVTGCDDGSVRLWDNDLHSEQPRPKLLTAFSAVPDLISGKKGGGIVTEWQQNAGRLIAGGDTKYIRCWDFETEKCSATLKTETGSCLTCLCTAWDYVHSDSLASSSSISPDLVVGGFDDGTVKVFDIRVHDASQAAMEMNSPTEQRKRRIKMRKPWRKEHSHWVVNVCFSQDPSKYEIISGSIYGDVRFWDIRMSTSVRTLEIQRFPTNPMTALACHPRLPLLASGSDQNFVKVFTNDGDVLEVIRHHDALNGMKIGRVSTLAFHPNRPLLAAGTTDDIISIYGTKKYRKMSSRNR